MRLSRISIVLLVLPFLGCDNSSSYSNNELYKSNLDYKLCVDTIIDGGGSWLEGTENCRKFKEMYDPDWH